MLVSIYIHLKFGLSDICDVEDVNLKVIGKVYVPIIYQQIFLHYLILGWLY